MPLPLVEARGYADRAIARATELGVRIGVAVVDELGQLVQLDRMDGAPLLAPDTALAKALTALYFQQQTSSLAARFAQQPGQLERFQALAPFTLLPLPGGLPLQRAGEVIGAIGVSGATTEDDERIAQAALG